MTAPKQYTDRTKLLALTLLEAAGAEREEASAVAYETVWATTRGRNGIDPAHVAEHLAKELAAVFSEANIPDWRQQLREQIRALELVIELDLPEDESDLFRK